jgi:predicted lipid-binding transport protein (Tim44 family)
MFAVVMGFLVAVQDADARRLGGGRSFGRQSPYATRPATPPSQDATRQATPQQPQPLQPPAAQPPRNRWLGPLAGLAAGLGIAALLSHFGLIGPFAEALGGFLLIMLLVAAVVVIWRMLRGPTRAGPAPPRFDPVYQGSGNLGNAQMPNMQYDAVAAGARPGSVAALGGAGAASSEKASGVPADFDVESFLRNAKVHFLRLQAAWDARDLGDIREFTTPEVFAEIKMQIDERKGERDRTEVSDLEAQLLGIEETADGYLASVRFSGRIRESENAPFESFVEVWNLWKPKSGKAGWLLAGIQQVH